MQKKALQTAGWIFLVMALMHAVRVLFHAGATIGSFVIPQFFSMIAVVAGILLAAWMFYAAR